MRIVKPSFLCLSLMLLSLPVQAADQGGVVPAAPAAAVSPGEKQPAIPAAPAPVPEVKAPAMAVPPPAPRAVAPPAPVAKTPAAATLTPPAGQADPQLLEKQRLAGAMLEFFKTECAPLANGKKEFALLGFFSRDKSPILQKCIDDLGEYVQDFWTAPEAAQALYIQAGLHRAGKDLYAETAALAKLTYVFNDTEWSSPAVTRILDLAVDELKGERDVLKVLAKGSDLAERTDRQVQFIQDFAKFNGDEFLRLLRRECDRFIRRYPGSPDLETVMFLREESFLREKQPDLAAAGFRRLIAVYPDSQQRPARMLTLVDIYDGQLKQYDQAAALLEKIIDTYPDRVEALLAYQRAARIYSEKLGKHARAVELLDRVVARYPKEDAARQALEYQAQINADKSGDYRAAVKSYQRLADMFKGDVAVAALVKAAELARKPMKDFQLQVELENRLVTEYPKRPEAIEALYDSGETLEDKLNNRQEAVEAYRALVKSYPDSKLADKARKRIEKLTGGK